MQAAQNIASEIPAFVQRPKSESALLQEHEKLIRYVAKAFRGKGVSAEDLMQEGRLAFLESARAYSSEYGASIWTFAFKSVVGAMHNLFEKERETHFGSIKKDGEDLPYRRVSEESLDCVASREISQDIRLDANKVLGFFDSLSEEEAQVVKLHVFEGKSFRDMELDGLGRMTAHRLYNGAIEKLRSKVSK